LRRFSSTAKLSAKSGVSTTIGRPTKPSRGLVWPGRLPRCAGGPDRLGKNPEAMDDVNAAAEESGVDADELLARLKREVEKLVDEHWPSIERVATVLQRHKVLTGAEVRDLI
jgi:hypothetical protein